MASLIVSQLFIYPVKSLGGFSVQQVQVLPKGFALDRRWMLIDEANRFLTQREYPAMSLFKTSPDAENGSFWVSFQGQCITVPANPLGKALLADVWGDEVEVIEVDPEISHWFTQHLNQPVRLVYFPETNPRPIDPDYALGSDNQTSLSDGYPILILGQSSLDDLNTRLEEKVPVNRFRPNIVFTGGGPFEEDGWRNFKIGTVPMAAVKQCARCIITTINQQTGEKGKEPLATLSSYRKLGNKVLFGQNVIPLKNGIISVGDEINFP